MTIIFLEISISISGFIIHIQEIMEDAINRMPLNCVLPASLRDIKYKLFPKLKKYNKIN